MQVLTVITINIILGSHVCNAYVRLPCSAYVKRNAYVRLPEDVKTARSHCKIAFESWKNNNYSDGKGINENYRLKRREYRFKLRNFLSQLEAQKITKLRNAADSNEKLFWRLLKGQRSTSQMTAFLVDGKLITDKKQIREMWADHFEELGTPSVSVPYDNDFLTRATTSVKDTFNSCTEDPSGVLNERLQHYEVEQNGLLYKLIFRTWNQR